VEEGNVNVNATSSEAKLAKLAKSAKLAKLVNLVKSTDLWCLSPYVPLETKDKQKQRKVCPVNLRGEVCTADNCGSKHPKVCFVANYGKGKIPKATCILWHMQIPRGNPTGNISNNNARPAGQARQGQVPHQAPGGVPGRGAQGEDQGNKNDASLTARW
jgi:hypothetical protein